MYPGYGYTLAETVPSDGGTAQAYDDSIGSWFDIVGKAADSYQDIEKRFNGENYGSVDEQYDNGVAWRYQNDQQIAEQQGIFSNPTLIAVGAVGAVLGVVLLIKVVK